MNSLREVLARNIRERRKSLGLSQEKLAERVGTSTNYIGQIELQNKFPTPEKLERIAEALEVDSTELFTSGTMPTELLRQFQDKVLARIGQAVVEIIAEERKDIKEKAL